MITLRYAAALSPTERPVVAAYGCFAALHRGHQELLRHLRDEGQRAGARRLVVAAATPPGGPLLASLRQRLAVFADAGVDVLLLRGDIASTPDWSLLARLGVSSLVSADVADPPAGITLRRVEALAQGGERIGPAAVRRAIAGADFARTRALLARPYAVDGRVVHGFHRGGPLGIPTANLRLRDRALPPDGVYAVRARLRGQVLDGVANIGVKPTFGDELRSVEAHLFDFSGDLYGQRLEIAFEHRIRAELKFASVDDLVAQIRRDIATARQLLAES